MKDLLPVLQLSVSPVILISGIALVLLSMVNRYSHIMNITRQISNSLRKANAESHGNIQLQLDILFSRARRLRISIILITLSLLMAAMLICTLFLASLLKIEAALEIVVLFIGCMTGLAGALILFVTDINMSLNALTLEFHSHSEAKTTVKSALVEAVR